jgi:hypothetical protein
LLGSVDLPLWPATSVAGYFTPSRHFFLLHRRTPTWLLFTTGAVVVGVVFGVIPPVPSPDTKQLNNLQLLLLLAPWQWVILSGILG